MGELPKTMKALVAYGLGDYRLEPDYPVPECGPDDILIRTEACGICAGDLKCMHGAAMFWGDEVQPRYVEPPFIPGHEFLGHIAAMGENVKGFSLGERITADQIVPCGECRFCKTGRYWMCQPHAIFGFQKGNNGGMAEYVRYPKTAVISRVPEEMPLEQALLIEPYGCSKHAVDRAQIGSEDVVVISGAGTLGLGMTTYARMRNPSLLIALDLADNRLEKAKELGASRVINAAETDTIEEIGRLTGGEGVELVFETAGSSATAKQIPYLVQAGGKAVMVGNVHGSTPMDLFEMNNKEADILSVFRYHHTFPAAVASVAAGNIPLKEAASDFYTFDQVNEAFACALNQKQSALKVIIAMK